MKKVYISKKTHITKKHIQVAGKMIFWFSTGVLLGLFFFISFIFILFQKLYDNRVYPGVVIDGVNFGGKTQQDVDTYFAIKNDRIANTQFLFTYQNQIATVSAQSIHLGFDSQLLAQQAFSVGRSNDVLSDLSLIFQAYINGLILPPAYTYDKEQLQTDLQPIISQAQVEPIDAVFTVVNGRVTTFHPSSNGQEISFINIDQQLTKKIPALIASQDSQTIVFPLPITTIKPKISTDTVNNLGVKELIGTGTSLFQHSIASRIYNVKLAASRVNGVLVAPGETFSFDKALGDVSSLTGYQQAYIIQNGRTVLGDGGGVCQVSTTLFRAILNAGLPIVERHAHAYRVGYYEEDSPPGLDATVYVPTVDLKFKNDTGHTILIQSIVDPNELRLTFNLYGTSDGRTIQMTTPVVTNQTPPPPPSYQDDPTLPAGTVQQVDFAAWGATVKFSRQVFDKNGNVMINETYTSNYQPWQAVYLRGTKS